jgi:hypothetical protein
MPAPDFVAPARCGSGVERFWLDSAERKQEWIEWNAARPGQGRPGQPKPRGEKPQMPARRRRRRSSWNTMRRDMYLTQRTMGDISAAGRGRLPQRVIRRRLVRSIFRSLRQL